MSKIEETNQNIQRADPLLSVDSLSVEYRTDKGRLKALRSIDVTISPGETFGLVGESGSGKSTLALAIMRYLGQNGLITGGDISYNGASITELDTDELRNIRGNHIAHVAQNPDKALNPSIKIGEQIAETIRLHHDISQTEAHQRMLGLLEDVGISEPEYNCTRYPHQLSGGMKQRVLLAIGLSCNPNLLILDEPTSGLDVTTQGKILSLIEKLKTRYDTAILLITHNLGVIARIADNVGIIYAGEMMEKGPLKRMFNNPTNPYTQGLLGSLPKIEEDHKLTPISGSIPTVYEEPTGCIFADRCELATSKCRKSPVMTETVDESVGHVTKCHRWETAVDQPINKKSKGNFDKNSEKKGRVANTRENILQVRNIKKYYEEQSFIDKIFDKNAPIRAVNGVDIDINEGEAIGIVGESGCGKSTLGRLLVNLTEPTEGTIRFRGNRLDQLDKNDMKRFRSECQMVFQNPDASLNPRKTVFESVSRPLKLFTELEGEDLESRIIQILNEVGLSHEYATRFPHELSGGEKQRVAIARAFAPDPSLIVLDEPVSALDVSIQANILNLLSSLKEKHQTSYFFISHDLSVVNHICDRVAVMYLGQKVESGTREQIFKPPHHPYTRALLSNTPSADPDVSEDSILLEGEVPSPRDPPSGCSFHTRCPQKIGDVCEDKSPELKPMEQSGSHCISCHLDNYEMNKENIDIDPSSTHFPE